MSRYIAKASMQIRGRGFGRTIGKGETVDLDAMVGGRPLREHVDLALFDPAPESPPAAPRSRRRRAAAASEE